MARKSRKIWVAGLTVDTSIGKDAIEKIVNDRYRLWLGKDTVKFEIDISPNDIYTLTFHRKHGIENNYVIKAESLFSLDKEIFLGEGWGINPAGFNLEEIVRGKQLLYYDDINSIFAKYKKLSHTRPKSMEIIEDKIDHFVLALIY